MTAEHKAVSMIGVVGSKEDDGLYGLCSCGFVGWVSQDAEANMLLEHITESTQDQHVSVSPEHKTTEDK